MSEEKALMAGELLLTIATNSIASQKQRIAELEAQVQTMQEALFTAASTFEEYAHIHAHKNPPDIRKAEFNQDRADQMRKALTSTKKHGRITLQID